MTRGGGWPSRRRRTVRPSCSSAGFLTFGFLFRSLIRCKVLLVATGPFLAVLFPPGTNGRNWHGHGTSIGSPKVPCGFFERQIEGPFRSLSTLFGQTVFRRLLLFSITMALVAVIVVVAGVAGSLQNGRFRLKAPLHSLHIGAAFDNAPGAFLHGIFAAFFVFQTTELFGPCGRGSLAVAASPSTTTQGLGLMQRVFQILTTEPQYFKGIPSGLRIAGIVMIVLIEQELEWRWSLTYIDLGREPNLSTTCRLGILRQNSRQSPLSCGSSCSD